MQGRADLYFVAVCVLCGDSIPLTAEVGGRRLDLRGRKRCLACVPYRPLNGPRRQVSRPVQQRLCAHCGRSFPAKLVVNGTTRSMYRRRFCLICSPYGVHNTSPRRFEDPRVRRRQSWVNYSRRRRVQIKAELVAARGGRCEDCGYERTAWALEFHHRDASTKEFSLGGVLGSIERARREAGKCSLVCGNCHRIRHARSKTDSGHPVVRFRRNVKLKAVVLAGAACRGCGLAEPVDALEFHHLDATEKDFGISVDGIPRSWARIRSELAKCVLLCANCHRETHAGLRSFTAHHAIREAAAAYRVRIACAA